VAILQRPALLFSYHSHPCRAQLTGPRLVAISNQPPSLLSPGWLPTSNWTVSLTNQLLHVTLLNWTVDNLYYGTPLTLLITFRHEPHREHCFICYSPIVPRPLYRNGCLFICLLHSNGCCLQSHRLAMGLYVTWL
jgi:hypothetical protein